MATPEITMTIDLGRRAYPIHVGAGVLDERDLYATHLRGRKALVVTNETVAPLYLQRLHDALPARAVHTLALPDGEVHKTLATLSRVLDALVAARFARDDVVVALGGGVVGDIAGFAAATYQRGIDFLQVPTTLLAQVDSSVGGKTGVNHPCAKNMIGAFHQPVAVFADTGTVQTLPVRELSAGLAEVVKYALIGAPGPAVSPAFFEWLESRAHDLMARDPAALRHAIEQSCRHKAVVVASDEREMGVRALLNLGHTFGHAIESALGFGHWLHGEAVAAGMAMAADLSRRMGMLDADAVRRIEALLKRMALPTAAPPEIEPERLRELMEHDKKVLQGRLRLILLEAIGRAIVTDKFDPEQLAATLRGAASHEQTARPSLLAAPK
ncbi:MAG: 3-dehydroquinate synthase [Gammaproteobacteria bacterium]